MRNRWLHALMGAFLVCLMAMPQAWAGQVVSERERNWARQALAQEAALDTARMPSNSLAVLYFTNTTGDPTLDVLEKGLAFMLTTDLSTLKAIVLVERVKLQALVEEMGLGASGLVDAGSAPRVGRLLGARFLVHGDISGDGTGQPGATLDDGAVARALAARIRIDPGLLNVPAGQATPLSGAEGLVDTLFDLEKKILFAIVEQLGISLSEDEKGALQAPMTTNARALFYFFIGLHYSDMGWYDQAGSNYTKAAQADPGLKPAGDALKELRRLGLYGASKKPVSLLKSVRNRTSLTNTLAPAEAVKRVRTPADVSQRQYRILDNDNDGDGYPANVDCDDTNPLVYPGAPELCDDLIDNNCDGRVNESSACP